MNMNIEYEINFKKLGVALKESVKRSPLQLSVCIGKMEISDPTYQGLVAGRVTNITTSTLLKITNWMGVHPSEFIKKKE